MHSQPKLELSISPIWCIFDDNLLISPKMLMYCAHLNSIDKWDVIEILY